MLSLLALGLVLVWLAQRLYPLCLELCPSLIMAPSKTRSRRRRGTHAKTAPAGATLSLDQLGQHLYTRDVASAIVIFLLSGFLVPSLLYQQAMITRALEVHVQSLPTIHWELFAAGQVCAWTQHCA